MKQQKSIDKSKKQFRKSQHFQIDEREMRRFGKRTGIYMGSIDQNTKKDGFARWSDYVTFDSDQLSIAREQQETEAYLEKVVIQSKDEKDNDDLQESSRQKNQNISQIRTINEIHHTKGSQIVKGEDKNSNIEPTISNHNQNRDEHMSPFSIYNVSQIKKRNSCNSLVRNSERFLLDLLEQEKLKFSNKKQQNEQEQWKRQEEKSAKNSKNVKNVKKSQKNQEQQQINAKNQQIKSIKAKQKRVTINDKGKIKLPNDSISMSQQFDYLLPSDLRQYESSIKKRQRQIIAQEQDSDDQKQKKSALMDIIDPQKQEKMTKTQVRQEKIYNQIKSQKIEKIQFKNQKRKKPIRVIQNNETKKSEQKSNNSKGHSQKSKAHSQKIMNQIDKRKNLEKEQDKRRKFKKNQVVTFEMLSSATSTNTLNERPKRNRTGKLKYWINEKPIYSKEGLILGISSLSSKKFLEMIGFSDSDVNNKIDFSQVYFTSQRISLKVTLKQGKTIYSSGINFEKMSAQIKNAKEFNQIQIESQSNQEVKIMIDDIDCENTEESIVIKQGQTFSLENLSDSKTKTFNLTIFHNSSHKA